MNKRPHFEQPDWSIEAIERREFEGQRLSGDFEHLLEHTYRLLAMLERIRITTQHRIGAGSDFDTNYQLLRQIQRHAFDAIKSVKSAVADRDPVE